MITSNQFGLSCALALPLTDSLEIDFRRLVTHAHHCLASGCSSVTLFGTTGEGPSINLAEREQILTALAETEIRMDQVVSGVTATSIGDAIAQARLIIERGCRTALVAPPFYFKSVTEEGLYSWFSHFCEKLSEERMELILYHIPSATATPLPIRLISRLRESFPKMIRGVKDSGSDWTYTEALLRSHRDLAILVGNECHLAAGVRLGASGAISGLANLCPEILLRIIDTGKEDRRIDSLASEILRFSVTPAIKVLLAYRNNDPAWATPRPPLVRLSKSDEASLTLAYDRVRSEPLRCDEMSAADTKQSAGS
jgi:4-hydroxy-tetrahydrodipicolinate synthase